MGFSFVKGCSGGCPPEQSPHAFRLVDTPTFLWAGLWGPQSDARYSCGQHLMFLDYSAASPECRFSVPAPESHRSVVLLAPIGEVVAESYPIRTVIQFSICPSIGSQREGSFINPLNNQLGTFLPFARKNFCKLFVNGGYNDKKSQYTAHQISGR